MWYVCYYGVGVYIPVCIVHTVNINIIGNHLCTNSTLSS